MLAQRPRRLCMVVHAYYPLAEPRVQREARAARDAGFDVTVVALRAATESAYEVIDGIAVRRLPVGHIRGGGPIRILTEYVGFALLAGIWLSRRSMRGRFGVVHVHAPPDFLALAALVARVRGSCLVLDIHDLSAHMVTVRVGGRMGRWLARLLLLVERLACAVADQVITVHSPYRRELALHGIPEKKLSVVMNSCDEELLRRVSSAQAPDGRSDTFLVAYHGTLTWWYGADVILDAIAILRDQGIRVNGLIMGDGDALPALRTQIAERRLGDQIELSGRYLPIEAALAAVAAAQCGVIPNRPSMINRFALSSKLFEYVALGIPVVVSRLETLERYFSDDEVTFFHPGDDQSLAGAVKWVLENPDAAQHKVRRAQIRAEAYSWRRNRAELVRLYDKLLRPVAAESGP